VTFLTHPDDATLQRLVDGALPAVEADATKAHLEECLPCRKRVALHSTVLMGLSVPEPLPQPPADFLQSVMARVEKVAIAPAERWLSVAVRALGAATAVGAAGGALFWTQGGPRALGHELADYATALSGVLMHSHWALAALHAVAPVVIASSAATLAVITPLFLRALKAIEPRAARVPVRG